MVNLVASFLAGCSFAGAAIFSKIAVNLLQKRMERRLRKEN